MLIIYVHRWVSPGLRHLLMVSFSLDRCQNHVTFSDKLNNISSTCSSCCQLLLGPVSVKVVELILILLYYPLLNISQISEHIFDATFFLTCNCVTFTFSSIIYYQLQTICGFIILFHSVFLLYFTKEAPELMTPSFNHLDSPYIWCMCLFA